MKKGFTVLELMITLVIFAIVIGIPYSILVKELRNTIRETSVAQSSIEKMPAIDVVRRDIEIAGFGLPWDVSGSVYVDNVPQVPEYSTKLSVLDDISPEAPKAIDGLKDSGSNGFSFLVLRSTSLNFSKASSKWSYISKGILNVWPDNNSKAYDNFNSGDKVILLDAANRRLIVDGPNFYFKIKKNFTSTDNNPVDYGLPGDLPYSTYLIYGVSKTAIPKTPFNKVVYFLHRPANGMPKDCARGTYILYRNSTYPLLSCVADFQVVFGLDTNGNGIIDSFTQNLTDLNASQIRQELKQIRVYILVQNGVEDRDYVFPYNQIFVGDNVTIGGRTYTVGRKFNLESISGYKHYRWSLIKIVVTPKNLGVD